MQKAADEYLPFPPSSKNPLKKKIFKMKNTYRCYYCNRIGPILKTENIHAFERRILKGTLSNLWIPQ